MARNNEASGHKAHAKSLGTVVTDQLSLAAYLTALGWQPTLVATPSGKVLFEFAATGTLKADVLAFQAGNASVNPATYDSARIALRRSMDAALLGRAQ
jgi:hypothetical protein